MTRFLSECLAASEPDFHINLRRLEKAHGCPSADIRLSSDIQQACQTKLQQLGLNRNDTTGEELYQSLRSRLKSDDLRLEKTLRTLAASQVSAEADVVAGMVQALKQLPINMVGFGLKTSLIKKFIIRQPPKRAMKQLGYRSLASMLKHESMPTLLAAAWLTESPAWRRTWRENYKNLSAGDFENRQITIIMPTGKKWQSLAATTVASNRHNLIAFKELAALVLLPLPETKPHSATTVTMALALKALNDIRATSSYLKLCQVRGDFGKVVQQVAGHEPQLQAKLLDQIVPWQLIQRYYARAKHLFNEELFEPHIHAGDLSWYSIEKILSHIEPSFAFWHNTAHVSLLANHQPVSCNILDVSLSHCNNLAYADRINYYAQTTLWHELMLRYLKPDIVAKAITGELQPSLVMAEAAV